MCGKASQTFQFPGALAVAGQALLFGAGVLTDLVWTGAITAATTPRVTLRDGTSPQGKVIVTLDPSGPVALSGMNLEFQEGLFIEYVPGAGPLFGAFTVGAYIQDRSPDPIALQLARIADEAARFGAINAKLAEVIKALEVGNPAA